MPKDSEVLANVEATLDGLSDPTPEEAYDALLRYETPMVAAAAARRALAGGGGGGGSVPVITPAKDVIDTPTQDGKVVNVFQNSSGGIALGRVGDDHWETNLNPGGITFGDGFVDPTTLNSDLYFDTANGIASDGYINVAKGIIFPTSDPMIVGAWWNNAGVLTISAAT